MSDVMLFGVLKMPYELAMSSELSRRQFYDRVQELVKRFDAEQPAQQQNEADELIRSLGFDPEQFRTEAGFINHMKLRAAIQHPDEYQAAMQPMYQKLTNCVLCGRLNPKEGVCDHGIEPAQQQCEYCKRGLKAGVCYCKPAQQQEPVAWKDRTYGNLHHQDFGNSIPLYTSPPAAQQKTEFVSPGGGYVPAIPRPLPIDWKLVPRTATPEMLKAMDECAKEGYDERLYEGMASSVYMAAWDASPVLGTLPPSEKEKSMMDMIVGNLVREGINKHRARELAEHFIKQCNYTNGYCTGRTDLLAEQKAQQPVAWMYDIARYGPSDVRGQQWRPAISRIKPHIHDLLVRDMTPLYISPPSPKPWVGLTQHDINVAFDDTQEGGGFDEFARAIEAKLKDKNGY